LDPSADKDQISAMSGRVDRPLVRGVFERVLQPRPRRRWRRWHRKSGEDDLPLPVLAVVGTPGGGKTEVVDAFVQRCATLPHARLDLTDATAASNWAALLAAVCRQLREHRPRLAPRPFLPRYDLAARIDQLYRESIADTRAEILDELDRLFGESRLVFLRRQAFRRLRSSGRLGVVLRPTPARRLLLGRSLHVSLRWYEERRDRLGAPESADGITVAELVVTELRNGDWHTAERRAELEQLRIAAFLADLRAAATRRWLGVPRHDRYVVFIDDAHRLPDAPEENLLELLLEHRRQLPPDQLLLVVTTDRRLALGDGWDSPRAAVGEAVSVDDAKAALLQWQEKMRASRAAGDTSALYLPLWLRGFTVDETRAFIESRHYGRLDQSVPFEHLRDVTRGHPLALDLLGRATETSVTTQPVRAVLDEPCPLEDAPPGSTIGDFLLARFTRDLSENATRQLAICCTPLQADRETLVAALGPAHKETAAELWEEYARSSCAEIDRANEALVFHPLLRDLQARSLAQQISPGDYQQVHLSLCQHFEQRVNSGQENARRALMYHALALGDVDQVVYHLERRLLLGGHTWLDDLMAITEAPNREDPAAFASEPPPDFHLQRNLRVLVQRLWSQHSATATTRVSADLLWDTYIAFLDLGLAAEATNAIHRCKDEASRFHEQYRIATGDEVRPPLPTKIRPNSAPYPPPRLWPYRLAQAAGALVVLLCGTYLWAYIGLSRDTCQAPAIWSIGDVIDARFRQSGLYASRVEGRQCVGLSDGSFAFGADPAARDVQEKIAELNSAVSKEHRRPATVVVLTTLTTEPTVEPDKTELADGVSELRGAYLALARPGGDSPPSARLLIANVGAGGRSAQKITEQVINTARADSTIVAVLSMGQPRDATLDALQNLSKAGIPVITSTNSYDYQPQARPQKLFRLAPTNEQQAGAAVSYIKKELRQDKVALIEATDDAYSQNLADAFNKASDNQLTVAWQGSFASAKREDAAGKIKAAVDHVCSRGIKVVYLAGRAADMDRLLTELESRCPDIHAVGGDDVALLGASSNEGAFPKKARGRLSYTAPARPARDFASSYQNEFAATGASATIRGSLDHAALAYDATFTLLEVLKYLYRPDSVLNEDFAGLRQPGARDAVAAELLLLHEVRLGRDPSDQPPLDGVTGPIDFKPYYQLVQRGGDRVDQQVWVKSIGQD
jgi:ABC-type branched-subunit amino acid transport system substrate-binding protein